MQSSPIEIDKKLGRALTVILPVYNAAEYLQEAIDSILSQTYTEFSLIIYNDGSTDDSLDVIKKSNHDSRVTVVSHTENRGKIAVVNEVVSAVKTRYFTVHDADDVSKPMRFEKQINLLESTGYAMCGTSFESIDESGHFLSECIQSVNIDEIREKILLSSQFHGPTMMIRTDIIGKVGGFYRIMKMGEDIDFSMRVIERYDAINLMEILYSYRIHPSSITKSRDHDLIGKLIDRQLIFTFAQQRRNDIAGLDSLMKGDLAQIMRLKDEVRDDFEINIVSHVNDYAGYLLHYGLFRTALLFVGRQWIRHPQHLGLLKIILYIIKSKLVIH